jgi:WD40 repeat protein
VNLDGPVRAADTAGSGDAAVTLSFSAWSEGLVSSTTHTLAVLPPKPGPKAEPVAANLSGSLIQPDRKASVWGIEFSKDGKHLLTAGYPSGIVQIWDWTANSVVRRIDTPPGLRGSAEYALISPDWKTLYVPVEKRTVKQSERDGKRIARVEQTGEIRTWDLTTGKEKDPIKPAEGTSPSYAKLSPDGRFLTFVQRPGYEAGQGQTPKDTTIICEVDTGKKSKLCDGYGVPVFAPDGKTVTVSVNEYEAKKFVVKLFDVATGKELAKLDCPEKDRNFSLDGFSPDGSLIVVSLGGKLGAPREVWFRDGKTLEDRGRFIGDGDPKGYGWGAGKFSPDSRHYVVFDGKGKGHVWDIGGKKVTRTLDIGVNAWRLVFSPNGTTLAVAWAPKGDEDQEGARDPDPRDLQQPRVTLFDLAGTKPPRVLIAPHGYVGGLAFSPDGKTLAFGGAGAVHLFDLTK